MIPVAKTSQPKVLKNFRLVALTSLVMKSFEKLIKRDLLIQTYHLLDPLVVYRAGHGVEDETATLLNWGLNILKETKIVISCCL